MGSNLARMNPTASRNLLKPLPALREPTSGRKFPKNDKNRKSEEKTRIYSPLTPDQPQWIEVHEREEPIPTRKQRQWFVSTESTNIKDTTGDANIRAFVFSISLGWSITRSRTGIFDFSWLEHHMEHPPPATSLPGLDSGTRPPATSTCL